MKWTVALACVVAVHACAKTARDLAPFPCANNLTCPEGLACVGGKCTQGQIDAICTTGDDPSDCGPGARCSATTGIGVCGEPCTSDTCQQGRICSDSVNGSCLINCNDGAPCPNNMVCKTRAFDNNKICVAPPACTAVMNVRACVAGCEADRFSVSCANSTFTCPAHSTCDVASTGCTCDAGLAGITCPGGDSCQPNCQGGMFVCAPNPASVTCDTSFATFQGTCACRGRTIDFACDSKPRSCEEACAE